MNHKTVVIAARMMLTMLLIAGLVVIGLGAATLVLGDPPEVEGWLRAVFGGVFAVVAFGWVRSSRSPAVWVSGR